MLLQLHIENFILIDNINIEFGEGFNVLTGETGAGKSIIIGAISLLKGGRINKDCVRNGANIAIIEGLFDITNFSLVKEILSSFGLGQDDTLIITREIHSNGRNICRINGRLVNLSTLKTVAENLINFHGQHDNQEILNSDKHLSFVDLFGYEIVKDLLIEIKKEYKVLQDLKTKRDKLNIDEKERERKLDLLKYQFDEINNANLKIGEYENINEKHKILSNMEEITKTINDINTLLYESNYESNSIIDNLNIITRSFNIISKFDNRHKEYSEIVQAIIYQLQDIYRELRVYNENLDFDPNEIKILEERIDTITNLKRKYGESIEEILSYKKYIESEINYLLESDKEIESLNKEISKVENRLAGLCEELSLKRKRISRDFETSISNELEELNMKNITFKVKFDRLATFSDTGLDKIEFLISTNIGEKLKSLAKIVSGGEMSRIMLAFKSIIADKDKVRTLIFDEIDSGISGKTAKIVGEKISRLSDKHQIICITHLPQIAAMSDNHFIIKKNVIENKTITTVLKLNENEKIEEIARLLSGDNLSEITFKHAKETVELAKIFKNRK